MKPWNAPGSPSRSFKVQNWKRVTSAISVITVREMIRAIRLSSETRIGGPMRRRFPTSISKRTLTLFTFRMKPRLKVNSVIRLSSSAMPSGSLSFSGEGNAISDFLTNRTGFVVLHPIEGVSGAACTVEHVDGAIEETNFPWLIDPVQPMKALRAITHEFLPGLKVTCRMEATLSKWKINGTGRMHPTKLMSGRWLFLGLTPLPRAK